MNRTCIISNVSGVLDFDVSMLCKTTPRLMSFELSSKVTFLRVKYLGWLMQAELYLWQGLLTHLLEDLNESNN
jgi:hypothetical protein